MIKKAKTTYLILGLGIGIIISSTFYSFFPQIEKVDLSDAIIIERAIELGMVNIKESINIEKIEENVEKETKEIMETKNEDQAIQNDLYVEIKIEKGEILQDVVNKLFDLKLIDNKEEFILLSEDKMRDKMFAYGTYSIKINTSYSTIIKILTKDDD